jgi:RNA recognition motif-containing protein
MSKRLFVGRLPWAVRDADLQEVFAEYPSVQSAQVIMDRETGRSKGFGFVEIADDAEADAAIAALDGKEVSGMAITVNEARPREERPRGNFGGGNGGGGQRGGGNFGGGNGGGGDRGYRSF